MAAVRRLPTAGVPKDLADRQRLDAWAAPPDRAASALAADHPAIAAAALAISAAVRARVGRVENSAVRLGVHPYATAMTATTETTAGAMQTSIWPFRLQPSADRCWRPRADLLGPQTTTLASARKCGWLRIGSKSCSPAM